MQIPMSFLKTWMSWRRRIHLGRKKLWFRCSEANTKTPQYEWLGPGAGISLRPAGEAPAERAAPCAAPTDETDSSAAGDRKGRPYSVFGDHPRVLWGPDTGRPAEGRKPPRAGGAHPRVASLSLRPIHLQPKIKKDFQTWVGEALGPPTRDVQHRKSPPSSASHALGTFSLEGRRLTGG